MRLIRYIHPIGQGAFYTEQFFDEKNKVIATFVYDCGAMKNLDGIEKEIRGMFNKGDRIDILFISHFHSDHINGIVELKKHTNIKNVVIPLYEKDRILMLLATVPANHQNNKTYKEVEKLIKSPRGFFGEGTRIIEVSTEDNISDILILDDNVPKNKRIKRGTPISIPEFSWEFIPYNFWYEDRHASFEEECNQKGVSLDNLKNDINNSGFLYDLRNVYKNISPKNNINENSMIVYSGLCDEQMATNCLLIPNACLYTGDASFNSDVISKLLNHLRWRGINLSMFQIPHHASKSSFNEKIFDLLQNNHSCPFLFVSCGNKNTYGHPSSFVMTLCNLFLRERTKHETKSQQDVSFITEQSVRIVCEDKSSMLVIQYDLDNNNKTISE